MDPATSHPAAPRPPHDRTLPAIRAGVGFRASLGIRPGASSAAPSGTSPRHSDRDRWRSPSNGRRAAILCGSTTAASSYCTNTAFAYGTPTEHGAEQLPEWPPATPSDSAAFLKALPCCQVSPAQDLCVMRLSEVGTGSPTGRPEGTNDRLIFCFDTSVWTHQFSTGNVST